MANQQIIKTPRRITDVPPAAPAAPATPDEAEQRFCKRYMLDLVAALLGLPEAPQPQTVEQWTRLAEATRSVLQARANGRAWFAEPEEL